MRLEEDEILELLDVLQRQQVVSIYEFRCARRALLKLLVQKTLDILNEAEEAEESDDPAPLPAPLPPPQLIWNSDRPRAVRIDNAELLDSAFGHWTLEGVKAPLTDHHPY